MFRLLVLLFIVGYFVCDGSVLQHIYHGCLCEGKLIARGQTCKTTDCRICTCLPQGAMKCRSAGIKYSGATCPKKCKIIKDRHGCDYLVLATDETKQCPWATLPSS